jgi:hypothetical protein
MNLIKFSHQYPKLDWRGELAKKAILVTATKVDNLENQHPSFLSYDTYFFDEENQKPSYYELDTKRPYLILLFFVSLEPIPFINKLRTIPSPGYFFTTIRPYNKQKEEYYKGLIGNVFDMVVLKAKMITHSNTENN